MIYAICAGDAIKIGYTAGNPMARMAELQTGNHQNLGMMGYWEGTKDDERKLHQQLLPSHCRGEWFWATDDVVQLVRIKRGDWVTPWEVRIPEELCAP